MNSQNFRQGRRALAVTTLLGLAALAAAPAAHANITTSGGVSFTTGSPTPTLSITAPITLSITKTGTMNLLVFDEWIASPYQQNATFGAIPQTLSYQLNGVAGTSSLNGLTDTAAYSFGSLTARDGYLFFGAIAVTAGQTLTINPKSFTFDASASFDPMTPSEFNGKVFGADFGGVAFTNSVSVLSVPAVTAVPEPSSWALMAAGALGLGVYNRRRAKRG